jgi:hypothetical protein
MYNVDYRLMPTSNVRGVKHEHDLPYALIRKNEDDSLELVATFHSIGYADQLRALLNEEVALA